jgi:dephospho-CoA kinase
MKIIGILGGVASGKSAVADMFESLGAYHLDADRAGHEVLADPAVQAVLQQRWGQRVIDAHGHTNRSEIAKRVFAEGEAGAEELRFLEATTHPRIAERLATELATAAENGYRAAVLDAPVMLKAGWDRLCTHLVFVDVPRAERERRARTRGWTDAEFTAREAAQLPLEQKRRRAETIIDNSGSLEETFEQVKAVWSSWQVDRD